LQTTIIDYIAALISGIISTITEGSSWLDPRWQNESEARMGKEQKGTNYHRPLKKFVTTPFKTWEMPCRISDIKVRLF